MKENTQEKNLVQKKESFFEKTKKFFRKLFGKKNSNNEVVREETCVVKENNNELKEYIKMTEDEETKLLELQRRYRRGEIAENDLTDEQIEALSNLYDKQIAELRKSIEAREEKIAEYKRRKEQKVEKNNA